MRPRPCIFFWRGFIFSRFWGRSFRTLSWASIGRFCFFRSFTAWGRWCWRWIKPPWDCTWAFGWWWSDRGGIKPCVSAHVGDQFGPSNQHLLPRAFSWFYFSINFGSTFSTLLTPIFLQKYGPKVAFGVPAGLMMLATLVFWIGRHKFIHIPPAGKTFVRETFSFQGLSSIGKVIPVFLFIPIFWSLFDQTASTWVLQGQEMGELNLKLFGREWTVLPEQMQTLNPILVMLLIPLFSYVIYPAFGKFFPLTPLRKIGLGFFVAGASFLVPAWIESRISAGGSPSLGWQLPAYILLTSSEILVSITALEFAYTQAPKSMKSLVMSIFLLTITLGNLITAGVNKALAIPAVESMLEGGRYFVFFALLSLVAGVIFIFVAMSYEEQTILHEETPAGA